MTGGLAVMAIKKTVSTSSLPHGWPMVIDRLFAAILTGLLTFAVSFLKDVADSVNKLNVQMGVVISRMENYDSRIEKLEDYNARIKR